MGVVIAVQRKMKKPDIFAQPGSRPDKLPPPDGTEHCPASQFHPFNIQTGDKRLHTIPRPEHPARTIRTRILEVQEKPGSSPTCFWPLPPPGGMASPFPTDALMVPEAWTVKAA